MSNLITERLINGKIVTVDFEDSPILYGYNWFINSHGYVQVTSDAKSLRLHRVVLGVTDSHEQIDHINHDKLDNRRCNLRVVTASENSRNRTKRTDNTSGYIGVHRRKDTKSVTPWRARCVLDGKRVTIGNYETSLEAAIAYDDFLRNNFEIFYLNFPKEVPSD